MDSNPKSRLTHLKSQSNKSSLLAKLEWSVVLRSHLDLKVLACPWARHQLTMSTSLRPRLDRVSFKFLLMVVTGNNQVPMCFPSRNLHLLISWVNHRLTHPRTTAKKSSSHQPSPVTLLATFSLPLCPNLRLWKSKSLNKVMSLRQHNQPTPQIARFSISWTSHWHQAPHRQHWWSLHL